MNLSFPDFGDVRATVGANRASLADFIAKIEERSEAVRTLVPADKWHSIHDLGEWTLQNCRIERMPQHMIDATKKQLGLLADGMPEDMLNPSSFALCQNVAIVFGERLRAGSHCSWEICVRKGNVNFHLIVLRGKSPVECAVHHVLPNVIERRLRGEDDRSLGVVFEIWRKILSGEGYDG